MEIIIEISKFSGNKYEVDKKTNRVKLDRVLYGSMMYPENYGYIEKTLAEDGDPLDAMVLSTYPFHPGVVVEGRLIGGINMIDSGETDTKLIYVTKEDPRYNHIQKLEDLGQAKINEIVNFFKTYKTLQKKKVEIKGFYTKDECEKILSQCVSRYKVK